MPTLCQTFRKEAGVVWNRMRTAARLGLALSEETLTECSVSVERLVGACGAARQVADGAVKCICLCSNCRGTGPDCPRETRPQDGPFHPMNFAVGSAPA